MASRWNEAVRVQIDSLDRQHEHLFQLISDLEEAGQRGFGQAVEKMAEFIPQVEEHFTTEERLFARFSYPQAAFHQNHHDNFLKTLYDFQSRIKGRDLALSSEITLFLSDWLLNHILTIDSKYSLFLVNAGVNEALV